MKITFPQNRIYKQLNIGKMFGDLWATWNIDLTSNPGKIRVSEKTAIITSSGDDADLGTPVAFVRSSADNTDRWWALCDTVLFKTSNSSPNGAYTQDAIASSPTSLSHIYSDLVDFNGALIASYNDDLARLSAGTWTASWWKTTLGATALATSTPHPLKVGFDGRLVIGDGQYCHVVDVYSNFTYKRLNFGPEYEVMKIKSSNSAYWISCRHKYNGRAKEFMWDGSAENYNYGYEVDSDYIYSGVIKDEIPHIIIGTGELLKFNGAGFSAIAQLPIKEQKTSDWKNTWTIRCVVHRNGMDVIGGNIHILLDGAADGNLGGHLENMPSGIWEYTKENGLYHKYSITKQVTGANDYGSPVIVKPGALVATSKEYGLFLAGCALYKEDGALTTTQIKVIVNRTSAVNNLGYIISPQILASGVLEVWNFLWLTFKKLANSTDYIQVKYRIEEKSFGDFDRGQACTWTSTTTFTTSVSAFSNASIGDEIEILSGEGSGLSTKITNITGPVTGVYTVTIADEVTSASGKMLARVLNWTHLDKFTNQNLKYENFSFVKDATWFEFKIVLFGKNDSPEINKMILASTPKIKS